MNNETEVRSQIESNFGDHKIRVQGLLKKRKESLRDFLIAFFEDWNERFNTIYVNTKEVQTDTGRRRSLGDIYMICKYYYPNCTLSEVFETLHDLCSNRQGFRTSYCYTINKRVYYYEGGSQNSIMNTGQTDEFGFIYDNYMGNSTVNEEEDDDDGF